MFLVALETGIWIRSKLPKDSKGHRMLDLAGLRILVVEDHPDSLNMLCAALHRRGAAIACTGSVDAALSAARSARPDVLISDLHVADDGARLAMAIDVPSIACSADGRLRQRAIDAGFDRFLLKPAGLPALVDAVRELADR